MSIAPKLTRLKVRRPSEPGHADETSPGRCPMSTSVLLTHDEHKASEAAFHGLPLNPKWSRHAQEIYLGILAVTNGRDIVKNTEVPALTFGTIRLARDLFGDG